MSVKAVKAIITGIIFMMVIVAIVISIRRNANPQTKEPEAAIACWSTESEAARSLVEFVKKVTDPADSANFIPEKDRIAVFDMDGTLACETYYTYYDTMMFIEYCLYDHPERVSDELKEHYTKGGLGDVKVKKFLNNVIQSELEPIRNRRAEYQKDITYVYDILKSGTEKAREVAANTLSEVKNSMKINYFDNREWLEEQIKKYS